MILFLITWKLGGFQHFAELFILFLKTFFLKCGPFLKSLLNLLQCCFCFMFFGYKARGMLAPQPGIEPMLPELEAKS